MKKLGLIFTCVCLGVFLGGAAFGYQYSVLFDPDAAGAKIQEQIWGWDLEASIGEQSLGATPVDFVTVQSLGADNVLGDGDTFTEQFTIAVLNGVDDSGVGQIGGYQSYVGSNLYLDVAFTGYITGYSDGGTPTTAGTPSTILDDSYTSIFDTGSAAILYTDTNGNQDYDVGTDTLVADFTLIAAGPVIIVPSVFGGNAAGVISFGYGVEYANASYFAQAPGYEDPQFLISQNWWLTFAQGGINTVAGGIAGDTMTDPDTILLGFRETGIDADFRAVPEPASMLLLGSGLVGLAGFGRRRRVQG